MNPEFTVKELRQLIVALDKSIYCKNTAADSMAGDGVDKHRASLKADAELMRRLRNKLDLIRLSREIAG